MSNDVNVDRVEPVVMPMTVAVQNWEGPQTIDEARCFDEGYKSGLTAYAREKGDSTLKSANDLLRRLMDEQNWKTIETFVRLSNVFTQDLERNGHHEAETTGNC